MNPMLEKLKKLKSGKKELSDVEKEGKMTAMKSLADMAKSSMGDKIKGLKKVTVASNSPEGLEKGLDMAKEIAEKSPSDEGAEMADEMDGEESAPEMALDESASAEELDAEIARLMELKQAKEAESV